MLTRVTWVAAGRRRAAALVAAVTGVGSAVAAARRRGVRRVRRARGRSASCAGSVRSRPSTTARSCSRACTAPSPARSTSSTAVSRRPRCGRARAGARAGARRRRRARRSRATVGVRERQLVGMVDRHDVQVRVRHLLADDQQADAARLPLEILGLADLLRDGEQVRGERRARGRSSGRPRRAARRACGRASSARSTGTRPRASSFHTNVPGQLARDDPAEDARHASSGSRRCSTHVSVDEAGAVDRAHHERRRRQPGGGTVARDRAVDDVVDGVRRRRARRRSRRSPAPVRRAPYAPAPTSASTSASSSGVETRKSSRSDAWLAIISRPQRSRSPAPQRVDERRATRWFSETTWRAIGSSATCSSGRVAQRRARRGAAAAASHAARRSRVRAVLEPPGEAGVDDDDRDRGRDRRPASISRVRQSSSSA